MTEESLSDEEIQVSTSSSTQLSIPSGNEATGGHLSQSHSTESLLPPIVSCLDSKLNLRLKISIMSNVPVFFILSSSSKAN